MGVKRWLRCHILFTLTFSYKMGQILQNTAAILLQKYDHSLLQNSSGFFKKSCDSFIAKCGICYNMRHSLQNVSAHSKKVLLKMICPYFISIILKLQGKA